MSLISSPMVSYADTQPVRFVTARHPSLMWRSRSGRALCRWNAAVKRQSHREGGADAGLRANVDRAARRCGRFAARSRARGPSPCLDPSSCRRARRSGRSAAGVMPTPVSSTMRRACRSSALPVSLVLIVRRPPSGMASRALTARLRSSCSIWLRSTRTGQRLLAQVVGDLDGGVDEPSQQPRRLGGHRVQVARLDLGRLAARQREQLPGEARRLLGGAQDRRQVELRLTTARREGELGVADDHRQQVVEVVGGSRRELADRLELLRRAKLAVERSLLGRVDEKADDDCVPLVVDAARRATRR